MRSKLIGLLLGFGIAASASAIAQACPWQTTTASNNQTPAQTAQADAPPAAATQSGAN